MKRRDFLKGCVCSACYGSLIGCPENEYAKALGYKNANGKQQLEIIIKESFSCEAGPMQVGLINSNDRYLFRSGFIFPAELTKGKIFNFPLPPLNRENSVRVVYSYHGPCPKHGMLETNIIYGRKLKAVS